VNTGLRNKLVVGAIAAVLVLAAERTPDGDDRMQMASGEAGPRRGVWTGPRPYDGLRRFS